jgi:ABC-type Fe3+ transport system permease subunit
MRNLLLENSVVSWTDIFKLVLPSMVLAILVGMATVAFCFVLGWIHLSGALDRFLTSYISPSQALMGLSGIVILKYLEVSPFVVYFCFLIVMFLPVIYRLLFQTKIHELQPQRTIAYLMGASEPAIFKKIIFPQLVRPVLFCGFVSAVWTLGDFALGKMLLAKNGTLAMLVESLMSSYRTEAAFGLIGILFLMVGALFLLYKGLEYVLGQKI